jgi:hypothetical protein
LPPHVFDQGNPRHLVVVKYLSQSAKGDERVAELLWHSVGRVWLKHDDYFLSHNLARIGMITHIADWLKVSVLDNAPWLAKVDGHGRPKKFLKFGTLEAIHAEADKQMRRKQASQATQDLLSKEDEVLHYDLGDGWSIVRMLSPLALDRESSLMQHCIGHGGYDEELVTAGTLLLSLRDPFGKPHVTIEIENGVLTQFHGKQNEVPLEKYTDRCLPFLREARIACNNTGFLVTDVSGSVYSVHDLPDALTVKGDLTIQGHGDRLIRLPKKIVVEGNVKITCHDEHIGFSNVPDVLHAGGSLVMRGLQIKALPATLKVGGSIKLDNSGISVLPDNLVVAGNLLMHDTPLRTIPSGLHVEKRLDLSRTNVFEIPGDLRCGSINIRGTAIRRFDTSTFLDTSSDTDFRALVAEGSSLEEIIGDPSFSRLNISGTKVSVLPYGLTVDSSLIIDSTPIKEIGPDVRLGGSLSACHCDITIAMTEVPGNVGLANSKVSLPPEFRCGLNLNLTGADVVEMSSRIRARNFTMSRGTTNRFPEFIQAELVDVSGISGCRLTGTVNAVTLRVSGDIAFIGKGVSATNVEVSQGWTVYSASVKEVRNHLERHGNLQQPPKNAKLVPFESPGRGSGKSTFMSSMVREIVARRGIGVVSYEAPIPFISDPEMMTLRRWEIDDLPVTR